jgi:type III secretion protein J
MNCFSYKKIILFVILFFLGTTLAGCSMKSLYEGLDERDTNEIIVLLDANGIKCEKLKVAEQRKTSFTILVKAKDLEKARKLLVENNLPRPKGAGLGELFKENELIPTETAEKAKFLAAIQGEIEETIGRIDGVVDVRAHINTPEKNFFSEDKTKKPTASILVKYIPDERGEPPFEKKEIANLVANAVEGLDINDVSIILSAVRQRQAFVPVDPKTGLPQGVVSFGPLKIAQESKGAFKAIFTIFILLLAILSGGLAFTIYQLQMSGFKATGQGAGAIDAQYSQAPGQGEPAQLTSGGGAPLPSAGPGAEGFSEEGLGEGEDISLGT